MQRLKTIGILVRPIVVFVVYILLIFTIFVLVLYPAPVWVLAPLAAVVAVAVVVLVVDVAIRISSVQRVIQRMVSRRLYEFIFKLSAHTVLLGVLVVGLFILLASTTCPGGWFCSDSSPYGAMASETALVQAAMYAMIAEQRITTVTANDDTTGRLGVNTWTDLPQGPGAASLDGYFRKPTTYFYYCWDSKGNVYAQNKTGGVRATPEDAGKQGPCKKAP